MLKELQSPKKTNSNSSPLKMDAGKTFSISEEKSRQNTTQVGKKNCKSWQKLYLWFLTLVFQQNFFRINIAPTTIQQQFGEYGP